MAAAEVRNTPQDTNLQLLVAFTKLRGEKKRPLASPSLSVFSHGKTRLLRDGFTQNLTSETFLFETLSGKFKFR
jgi:hypothetical protein